MNWNRRLQNQQEELRQTNEELQEQTQLLEEQKEDIQKKNLVLEMAGKLIEEKAGALERTSRYKSYRKTNGIRPDNPCFRFRPVNPDQ